MRVIGNSNAATRIFPNGQYKTNKINITNVPENYYIYYRSFSNCDIYCIGVKIFQIYYSSII